MFVALGITSAFALSDEHMAEAAPTLPLSKGIRLCSPKDGFIASVSVADGSSIDKGAVVLQLDTEEEVRALSVWICPRIW